MAGELTVTCQHFLPDYIAADFFLAESFGIDLRSGDDGKRRQQRIAPTVVELAPFLAVLDIDTMLSVRITSAATLICSG